MVPILSKTSIRKKVATKINFALAHKETMSTEDLCNIYEAIRMLYNKSISDEADNESLCNNDDAVIVIV